MFGIGNVELIIILANFILIIAIPVALLIFIITRLKGNEKNDSNKGTSPFSSPEFIENQHKILEMIQQGKINIDDGEKLLAEINKKALMESPASSFARPLRRRSDNKIIGGVCGAIADYFMISSPLVRLGFLLVAIITGFFYMAVFYITAIFVLPYDK